LPDHALGIWELITGKELGRLIGHKETIWTVNVIRDGKEAVSTSVDRTFRVWDLDSRKLLRSVRALPSDGVLIAAAPDGQHLISGKVDQDISVDVWSLLDGKHVGTLRHNNFVTEVVVTPDGQRAVVSGGDTLSVWNLADCAKLRTMRGHEADVVDLAVAAKGEQVISVSEDKTIRLWDLNTGDELLRLTDDEPLVRVALADAGRVLSLSTTGWLKVWDLQRRLALAAFCGDGPVGVLAVTADGTVVIASEEDGRMHFLRFEEVDQRNPLKLRATDST
jgi:WD40 repeat protein